MGVLFDTISNIKRGMIPVVGKAATCRDCGKQIVRIATSEGKKIPCELAPVYYREAADGKEKIVTPNGDVISCEILKTINHADGLGWIPHSAKCSKAGKPKQTINEINRFCKEYEAKTGKFLTYGAAVTMMEHEDRAAQEKK